MLNLFISTTCTTQSCGHDVRLYPTALPSTYEGVCGGCETPYSVVAMTPDEFAWHDTQVLKAALDEENRAAAEAKARAGKK